MKLKGRYYTVLEVVIIKVLFLFSSLDSCHLRLEGIIYLIHALQFTLRCDKKHDHQQNILQSIVYLSIVRREPWGKSDMFEFSDDWG